MKLYDFLFTKKYPEKYFRHILFWLIWFIYLISNQFYSNYFNPQGIIVASGVKNPFTKGFAELLLEMELVYCIVYFLVPRFYLKNKKSLFIIFIVISTLFAFSIYYLIQDKTSTKTLYNIWFNIGNFLGIGPVFICSLFMGIKMMKNYYIKLEEKEIIEKEKTNAEIQYLKAQVHPHFLFNTLNNIYSFALNKSPLAGSLVMKLYDTLTYMINDCKADLVPLEKELKMIEDYIGLEKVRYGDRLEMQLEITGDYKNKLIAPLLLIPFVENSFKHGSSKMLKHPWIKLCISIKENELYMNLSNSRPLQVSSVNSRNGIGLKNVQKRLQLLYSGKYELLLQPTDDEFSVHLQIPLEPIASMEKAKQLTQTSQILNYA